MKRLVQTSCLIGALAMTQSQVSAAQETSSDERGTTQASPETSPPSTHRRKSILLGHNLTPTTDGLAAGDVTVGTYAVAVGITNATMIATSPWMMVDYGFYNAVIRHRFRVLSEDFHLQAAYFKSGLNGSDSRYKMESYSVWLNKDWELVPSRYRLTVSTNWMYFVDERAPFSLRRQPFNGSKQQFTLSTLHEFRATDHFGALVEVGILGLNFKFPNYHFGTSVHYRNDNWLFQLGVSATGVIKKVFELGEHTEYYLRRGGIVSQTEDEYYRKQVSIHPELQVQYFF
ncbi:MAG: hypothetical protein EOP09_08720 [Proteobacteria bacterium]|nr:MAG: hypothetical protein EOP09_08720 [Pseudomonadota bacterium]